MATRLGFATETQLIYYVLSKLAKEALPTYELDDSDLTESEINAIRRAVPQNHKSVKSSLF